MKNQSSSSFILILAGLFTAGCSTTNKQQIVNSTSGDGVQAKVSVPVTASASIGASLFVGRFNNTTVVQPTSTNGPVYAPNLALVVAGAGRQSVTGSAGATNGAAGISDGSRDASILTTGGASVLGQNGTNVSFNINSPAK